MILIADAGGTSIKWRIIAEDGNIKQALTEGFNPYVHSLEKFRSSLLQLSDQFQIDQVTSVFYYGAGLLSEENKKIVLEELKNQFGNGYYEVNHDLLAAARALLGNEAGIACILGTGSNSCYYDGTNIVENKASLGYIVGDEGSGNALGKELLRQFCRGGLPADLHEKFKHRYEVSTEIILKKVYSDREGPDYISGFTKFLFDHMKHPFVYQLIYKGFEKFFDEIIAHYKNVGNSVINFSGSIAFYYANILRQVGNDKGYTIKTIVEDPIAGLTLYHQNKEI